MTDKKYDILKAIALLIAPIVVLVSALCSIWGIPYGEQIVATLSALDVFFGAVVTIAKKMYDKNNSGE